MTGWPVWLLALVDVLAVHRLVRLVTEDIITTRLRWRVIRWSYLRAGHPLDVVQPDEGWHGSSAQLDDLIDADMSEDPCDAPRLAVLVRCRWCASIWIAAGAVAAHQVAPVVWLPVAAVLALSSLSTLLAALED